VGRWKIILKNNLKKVFEFVIFAQLVDYRIDALEFFFSKDRSDEKKLGTIFIFSTPLTLKSAELFFLLFLILREQGLEFESS
jgi:hypothetical protein